MNMIKIHPATTTTDFECVSQLAHVIWHEHYPSILSLKQIDYMLEKFNSVSVIDKQTKEGSRFFYITYHDVAIGYTAIKEQTEYLFIEKIYVLEAYRGKKIAKTIIQFIETIATDLELSKIKLHVNKGNVNAILAYEKMGFVETKSLITDIGNGFFMDDFEMEKRL